jgi:hypothetical protein
VHGKAIELAAKPYGKVADVDHLLHLAQALLGDFACLYAYQAAQLVFVVAEGVAYLADNLAALGGG